MIKDFLSKKNLLRAAKAVYYVYSTYNELFGKVKGRKRILRQSYDRIVKTIETIRDIVGFNRALNAFGISYQQFYAWRKRVSCLVIPSYPCRRTYHNQLTAKELSVIRSYLAEPQYRHWSVTSVYYQILRHRIAFFSLSTFYKYVTIMNLQRAKPEKKKYSQGIRADAPKRILHMDVTIFRPADHSKVYLYFLVDNFSRYILSFRASLEYSAEITFENIREAYQRYNLHEVKPYIELICDDGSENKGKVDTFASDPSTNLRKLIAQSDIRFSNSMVEAVNKRMKYDYLFTTRLNDFEQTLQYLPFAVEQYNSKPHSSLYGLTPAEAARGMLPDRNMFKPAIQQAATKRKSINMGDECLSCFENKA
jgi:putative transposase